MQWGWWCCRCTHGPAVARLAGRLVASCAVPWRAQGLGKTVQVAALLCHLAEQGEERPSLVAVPPSVLPNWEAELARWAPGLRVVSYKGSAEAREAVWEKRMACGRGGRAGPGTHVVLVAYDFLMSRADK